MGKRKGRDTTTLQSTRLQLVHQHKEKVRRLQWSKQQTETNNKRKAERQKAAAHSPYNHHHRLLLLGEGNFSFAHALLHPSASSSTRGIPAQSITATALDNEQTVTDKYPDADNYIKTLTERGARVLTGIDATQLHVDRVHFPLPSSLNPFTRYHRVVFNFPHTGCGIKDTQQNIQHHQRFLTNIFASILSANVLLPDKPGPSPLSSSRIGELHVTLKRGPPYDDWKIVALCRQFPQLHFHHAFPFHPHLYPGYQHRRTIGYRDDLSSDDNDDISHGATTYVFVRDRTEQDDEQDRMEEERETQQREQQDSATEHARLIAEVKKIVDAYDITHETTFSQVNEHTDQRQEQHQQSRKEIPQGWDSKEEEKHDPQTTDLDSVSSTYSVPNLTVNLSLPAPPRVKRKPKLKQLLFSKRS